MPDTYLDSSVVGFDHQDAFDAKIDTYKRLAPILNTPDTSALSPDFAYNLSIIQDQNKKSQTDIPKVDIGSALISSDNFVKASAMQALKNQADQTAEFKFDIGRTIESPLDDYSKKFIGKDFSYSALRDNEDFYYNNQYMQHNWFTRNVVLNPLKFTGRVIGGAAFKLIEGIGYVGAMFNPANMEKGYWANIADNAFSKWFEAQEQTFKDQVIPIYKQAGFDDKGFFDKLNEGAFWTDSVADGVAFMASAAIPGMAFSKLGALGAVVGESANWFGRAFETSNLIGKIASRVGMASPAQIASWAFNTGMEAAVEGSGVFKEMSKRMKEGRDRGEPAYANLTDEDIRLRAGDMAASTVAGNWAVLALSNAWENKLFFKPFKKVTSRASIGLAEDLKGMSPALTQLEKKGIKASLDITNPLRRVRFYGGKAVEGTIMEGLWEENAQLAIQRMNQNDAGDNTGLLGFFSQLGTQSTDAFTGNDKEAAESIGLGVLIGIAGGGVFSKVSNERREKVANTQAAVEAVNTARQNLFTLNDVYERDPDHNIVFENNKPKLDSQKVAAKKSAYDSLPDQLKFIDEKDYFQNSYVKFNTRRNLADYVRSLNNIGIDNISSRLSNISPENAVIFGMDPNSIKEQSAEFGELSSRFETISKEVDKLDMGARPNKVTTTDFLNRNNQRKANLYRLNTDNIIYDKNITDAKIEQLKNLNKNTGLNSSSLGEYVSEQINLLINLGIKNKQVINATTFKNLSELEQQYHINRDKELREEVKKFKKDNEVALQETKFYNDIYVPQVTNSEGNKTDVREYQKNVDLTSTIANFESIHHKNSYKSTLFSDKENGYNNYEKWHSLEYLKKSLQQAAEAEAANEVDGKEVVVDKVKYREENKGDFDKLLTITKKTIFSDNKELTEEEKALTLVYPELYQKLLVEYEDVVENQRIKNLESRLKDLKDVMAITQNKIAVTQAKNLDNETEIEILIEDLQNIANSKKVDQKKIAEAINELQKSVIKLDDYIIKKEEKLAAQSAMIQQLEDEIAGGNFKGLEGAVDELKQERDWLSNKINETKSLVDRLSSLLRSIIRLAYKLFGGKSEFNASLNKGRWETVSYQQEIQRTKEDLAEAKKLADELAILDIDLRDKYLRDKAEVDAIINQSNQIFRDKYLDLTKAAPQKVDKKDTNIGDNLSKGGIPPGVNSYGEGPDEFYDGPDYLRPLSTKFFTTTLPFISATHSDATYKSILDAPKSDQDYLSFVDFISDPNNEPELKKKLPAGSELRVLIVTKNNIKELGLADILGDRKDKNGNSFFDIEDPANTHMEIIPVIRVLGIQFYVDDKLNRLGRVGEKPTGDIVRTYLPLAKFKESEKARYAIKYDETQMELAIKTATTWRESLLDLTKKDNQFSQTFSATRGIANKKIEQDGTVAKNPVVGTLMPRIYPTSVRVYSDKTAQTETINGQGLEVNPGVPYIYTNIEAGEFQQEQLHAANNAKLNQNQIETISVVFNELVKDHIKKVMDVVQSDKSDKMIPFKLAIEEAGSLSALDALTKANLYLYLTSTKVKLYDPAYTNFLSSIIYFGQSEKGKPVHSNQFHFKGPNIVYDNTDEGIDLTTPFDITNDEGVQAILQKQFHSIKYFSNYKKSQARFTEFYLKDGKLETRVWNNYATYLLSEKLPNGQLREEIPVTTGVKTKEQYALEETKEPYYKYLSRGLTINSTQKESIKKNQPQKTEPTKKESEPTKEDVIPKSTNLSDEEILVQAMKSTAKKKETVSSTDEEVMKAFLESTNKKRTEKTTTTEEDLEATMLAALAKTNKKRGEVISTNDEKIVPEEVPPAPEEPTPPSTGFTDNDAFRVSKFGVFNTEQDLDAVAKEINRMLPQVSFERLKEVIRSVNGIEAWGQFIDNTIKVYEGAEEGTAWHEVFEAVANKILSDKEWNAIAKEFSNRNGYFTDRETGNRVRYAEATPQQIKEELAEEFRDYKMGTEPRYKQAKSFFKILWDFIKNLFSNAITINKVFDNIEKGKFAHTPLATSSRFTSNYRLVGFEVQTERDLLNGATAWMFKRLSARPGSIADIDEFSETDEVIYEGIRSDFTTLVNDLEKMHKIEKDEFNKANFSYSITNINRVLGDWGNFVKAHQQDLKKFKIKFGDEDLTLDEVNDITNRNDYAQNDFKVSGKASASKAVKFLFGTLLELKFNTESKIKIINNSKTGEIQPVRSSIFTFALANYDDYMLRALEQFQGLSNFDMVEQKMKDLAGISRIENMQSLGQEAGLSAEDISRAQQKVVQELTEQEAVWTSLYQRVFGQSDKIDEEAAIKLKIKFHSYVAKQAPNAYLSYSNGYIHSSVRREFYETLTKKIENSINSQRNKLFRVSKNPQGLPIFTPAVEFQKTLNLNDFTKNSYAPNRARFIEFLGLNSYLTPEFEDSLTEKEKGYLNGLLVSIRNMLAETKATGISLKSLNIVGYTNSLINFIDNKQNIIELSNQFLGINNEMRQRHITPSFISRVLYDLDNAANLQEVTLKYPQLATTFSNNSILIDKMFLGDSSMPTYLRLRNKNYRAPLGYMEGIKNLDENEGTPTARLEFVDKYMQQFNASLEGLYFSLPADSETEWLFNFGLFEEYDNNIKETRLPEIIERVFLPKLRNELEMTQEHSNLVQLNDLHKTEKLKEGKKRTIGESLRFFKNMLSFSTITKIYTELDKGTIPEKVIIRKKLKELIVNDIKNYILNETKNSQALLEYHRVLLRDGENYIISNLNNSFLEANKTSFQTENGLTSLDKRGLEDLLIFQKVNTMIASMESFQIIFGDPAQYKDWEKRAKSLFSPYEQTYYDATINNWLNDNKNYAVLEDERVELDDMFRYDFGNTIKSRTIDDFNVVDTTVYNDLHDTMLNGTEAQQKFIGRFIDTYGDKDGKGNINEPDGQSIGTIQFARHLMIKSGWRWTNELEKYYQYDTALMRRDYSKSGKYIYPTDNKLKNLDEKIIEFYKENPPTATLTPIKTLMPSVTAEGHQILLKHSIYFMSYQISKGFELEDLYVNMLTSGDDLLNFRSTQKVGLEMDNNNEVTPYYNNLLNKTDLVAAGNIPQELDMRTIGIQVETQGGTKGQTLGTQLSVLSNLNLFSKGIPVDFSNLEDETDSDKRIRWNKLSHEEKIAISPNYDKVYGPKGSFTTLQNLKEKNALDKLTELGVDWNYNKNGEIEYNIKDISKIKKYITDELERLEVDYNTIDNIVLNEEKTKFLNPAETLPSYTTIANLMWSIADKSISKLKVNGKSMVQVSSAFFNKNSRKAAYKGEDGKWITVDNKADYDKLVAEGKQLVMTSSELNFYRRNDVTGETEAMEVYLPHIYFKKVNEKRIARGLSVLTEQELMDYLNDNPTLLEGIGFRIPTQATSSLEFFKIKGFLNPAFGNAIVVPSAITAKAGSDFDVDKLSTYLNNWYLNKEGFPTIQQFKDSTNSSIEDRYIAYVKNMTKGYREIEEEMKSSSEYLTSQKLIDEKYSKVGEFSEDLDLLAKENTFAKAMAVGSMIFGGLPLSIKQQYWKFRQELIIADQGLIYDQASYYDLTTKFINSMQDGELLELELIRKDGTKDSEIVDPADVIPIMERMLENYSDITTILNVKKDLFDKLVAAIAKARSTKDMEKETFKYEVASIVAEATGLKTIDQFEQLPIYMQNTKDALENEYFASIRRILKDPSMFEYLLSPNSTAHIEKNRDAVYAAQGKQKESSKDINYANFTSTEWIAQKRLEFTKGKYDIGIFAITMTNFANSQVTGIGIASNLPVKSIDKLVFDKLNEGYINLPFEDIKMDNINGRYYISISEVNDIDGNLVMDKLSAYINGAVDVAKDPIIIQMGMHTELAGTYALMERMGLTGETTSLFLMQPAVRELLHELILRKSHYGNGIVKYSDIIDAMVSKYQPKDFTYDPNYKLSDIQLTNMLSKSSKEGYSFNEKEKEAQYYTLINFLKLKMMATNLLESVQASNHNNAGIRDSSILLRKDFQLERAKEGNVIAAPTEDNFIQAGQALRDDTFVSNDIMLYKLFEKVFGSTELFALQRPNPKAKIDQMAERIFRANPFQSNDEFTKIYKEFQAFMVDSLINKVQIIAPNTKGINVSNALSEFTKRFFVSSIGDNKITTNLAAGLDNIKRNFPQLTKSNYLLQHLTINSDPKKGIDMIELTRKPGNTDVYTKKLITEAFEKLANDPREEVKKFYESLLYASLLQFGIKFSRRSIVNMMPVFNKENSNIKTLTDITKTALKFIDNEDFSDLDEKFYRSKSHVKGVVEKTLLYSTRFLELNKEGKYELTKQVWHSSVPGSKAKPTKSSQTFFSYRNEEGEMVPNIKPMLMYAGKGEYMSSFEEMDDYVIIPAVRPEYTVMKLGGRGAYKAVSPEVEVMRKRGDHSYLYDQLFIKVGVYDKTKARAYYSENKKTGIMYKSYLYRPIHNYGAFDFGEIRELTQQDDGSYLGPQSIINRPYFEEESDESIISRLDDNKLLPEFEKQIVESGTVTESYKISKILHPSEIPKPIREYPVDAINAAKIAAGTKTLSIKNLQEAGRLKLGIDQSEIMSIAGDMYEITNIGRLSISEAGGLQNLLNKEAFSMEDVKDYSILSKFIKGEEALFVYTIKKQPDAISNGKTPSIIPLC